MRGTGRLLRLALRLDRVWLTVWIAVISLLPLATAANYKKLYPTPESLDAVERVIDNASLRALSGRLFQVSIGGLTTWKIGVSEIILVALMSLLTVVRHTRTEEETGRAELLGAGIVGRYAPLTAALLEMVLANAAIAVLSTLFLVGVGLPAAGSVAFGLMVAFSGMLFAVVAAVAAQITQSARSATGIAIAVLGGTYLLRAIGDTGPTWLSWISPVGWALFIKPYAADAWWVAGLFLALFLVLAILAYSLVARRDVGLGLVPDRPAAAQAAPSLRSSFALAWRLHRGPLFGWIVGLAAAGAVFGGAGKGLANFTTDNQQMLDLLDRMGGPGVLVDQFFGAAFGIVGLTAAAYTVSATLRMRGEESAGRLEPLLAADVGRVRWALSHLVFAFAGTAALLLAAGLLSGVSYGAATGDAGQIGRLVAAAMVQLPAAWVLSGLGVLLFGFVPRWTSLLWAALVVCVVVMEVGAIVGLDQWVIDISPFAHAPRLPGSAFTAMPLIWLTLVTAVLAAAGLARFRRRDLATG